jgi:hypothetical protein
MKKLFIIIAFAFSLVIYGLSLSPLFVTAQGPLLSDSLIEDAECSSDNCSLNTFIALGVSLSNIILGLVGALTLAMFIYGGVTLLISGGSAEKISKGKEIILGSVVGLLIVFGSYTIIKFVVNDVLDANNKFTGSAPPEVINNTKTIGEECRKLKGGQCIPSSPGTCIDTWGQLGQTVGVKDCGAGSVCCDYPDEPQTTCRGSGYSCEMSCSPPLFEPEPLDGFPCAPPSLLCCKRSIHGS